MNLNGKIIVIEGTDGSGKQTQAEILRKRIEEAGFKVYWTSFPRYDSDSSAPVRMYLNREISSNAEDVSAKAASMFYAVDRYITYKREFESIYQKKEHVLVFDRWVASNIIHQGAKIISEVPESKVQEELSHFVEWLEKVEHTDFGVPKADITFYLNVPYEVTVKLRENRLNKSNGEEKQDIHESDKKHLMNASKSGLFASQMLGWKVIECTKEGNLRSIDDISSEIWSILEKTF